MTTNDKEYMRNYQRERRAKLKNVKIVKKSVKIDSKPFKSRWDPSNLSILRTFFYFLTGENHRGSKKELKLLLIKELGK